LLHVFASRTYQHAHALSLNTRQFVRGRGTDREEGTGPTFLMVGNPFGRAAPRGDDLQRKGPLGSVCHFPRQTSPPRCNLYS